MTKQGYKKGLWNHRCLGNKNTDLVFIVFSNARTKKYQRKPEDGKSKTNRRDKTQSAVKCLPMVFHRISLALKVASQIRVRKKSIQLYYIWEQNMLPATTCHQKLRHYIGEEFCSCPSFALLPVHQQLIAIRPKIMDWMNILAVQA